ncbi:SRPBCC family protein [Intrasporangium mesophilum]
MGVIELELTRAVPAPIEHVFARLADINGYNDWMPREGSICRHSEQTSLGQRGVGTTYLDRTAFGPAPGEIAEYEPPHTLVYHWWDRSRGGRLNVEGWPAYALVADGPGMTVVHHRSRIHTHGLYRGATPFLRRVALRERTTIMDALMASFGASA